jgi:5-(carboxyamino)imidazole ribonucleotide synthase
MKDSWALRIRIESRIPQYQTFADAIPIRDMLSLTLVTVIGEPQQVGQRVLICRATGFVFLSQGRTRRENDHRGGILAVSVVPARIDDTLAQRVRDAAIAVARTMNYVGVLCVEFFVLTDGRLLANEIAPRPHNSGHYTIDACVSSQFDEQARVLAGQPLGDASLLTPAVMLNVLGDVWFDGESQRDPDWPAVLAVPGAKLHLYGKSEARRGRKMGHVTCVASTRESALARATQVATVLGITPPQ